MNKALAELLDKKQMSATSVAVDWDERRDRFLAAVADLYRQVEAALDEPARQKKVSIQRRPKQLTENYIGTYTADDLVLVVGDEQVRFSPRGRNIAGAAGRVDVVGERAEAVLIFQPESGWAFVQSRQPTLRTVPFDESALVEVLRLVMRD